MATYTPDYSDRAQQTRVLCHPHSAGPGAACNATGVHVREVLMRREHSDIWLRPCKAFGFRRLRPPQGLLFSRQSDIPGCAMSGPIQQE